MKCFITILGWAVGIPAAACIGLGLLGALMIGTVETVVKLGFSQNVGFGVFLVSVLVGLGVAIGIAECREAR